MPRKQAISDLKFIEAYKKARNVQDLANAFNASNVTIYNYLKRLNLKPPKVGNDAICTRVFNAYKGRKTFDDLSIDLKLPVGSIRHYLRRGINIHWGLKRRALAKPNQLRYVKIVHVLEENPALVDDLRKVARITGLKVEVIEDYLRDEKGGSKTRLRTRRKSRLDPVTRE